MLAFVHVYSLVPPLSLLSQTTHCVSWRGADNHPYLDTADPKEEKKRFFGKKVKYQGVKCSIKGAPVNLISRSNLPSRKTVYITSYGQKTDSKPIRLPNIKKYTDIAQ